MPLVHKQIRIIRQTPRTKLAPPRPDPPPEHAQPPATPRHPPLDPHPHQIHQPGPILLLGLPILPAIRVEHREADLFVL
jgi:hypothetical protein